MVDIAVLLGAVRSRAELELAQSLDFEIALANVSQKKNLLFINLNHQSLMYFRYQPQIIVYNIIQ